MEEENKQPEDFVEEVNKESEENKEE